MERTYVNDALDVICGACGNVIRHGTQQWVSFAGGGIVYFVHDVCRATTWADARELKRRNNAIFDRQHPELGTPRGRNR